jgi:hypothetical protein
MATLALLHTLSAGRRRARARGRLRVVEGGPPAETLGAHPELGPLATAVHDKFEAARVTVVLSDGDDPATGVVAACVGAPGLLGYRVPMVSAPVTGVLSPGEAAAIGLGGGARAKPWAFAQLPIAGEDGPLGELTLAARREDAFSPRELRLLERIAREEAPEFDRRRHALIPREIAE